MNRIVTLVLVSFVMTLGAHAEPLKPSFMYQGQLLQSGALANGTFDFQFEVYDVLTGGTALSSVFAVENVTVTDGLFDTELVFSNNILTGDALWLEVGVRAGASTGSFTVLAPRQPFLQFALNGKAAALSAALTGTVTKTALNTTILGSGTLFTQEIAVDDSIQVGDEIFSVVEILNDTQLILDSDPVSSAVDVIAFTDGDLFTVQGGDKKDKLIVDRAGVSLGQQGTPIGRLEHGTVSTCSTINNTGVSGIVQFTASFTTPPRVFMSWENCQSVRITATNETSFSWNARDSTGSSTQCDCIHWMAIGI